MWQRKNKYGGAGRSKKEKIQCDGYWFDSKLEAALYERLAMFQRGGAISDLKVKPGTVFLSPARIQYRPDFSYVNNKTGEREWAEAKGYPNDKWPMKKKLWKAFGPGVLHIYQGSYKSFRITETITPLAPACPHCGR